MINLICTSSDRFHIFSLYQVNEASGQLKETISVSKCMVTSVVLITRKPVEPSVLVIPPLHVVKPGYIFTEILSLLYILVG